MELVMRPTINYIHPVRSWIMEDHSLLEDSTGHVDIANVAKKQQFGYIARHLNYELRRPVVTPLAHNLFSYRVDS